MGELTLVIGNKNYSSWSLRPWLVLRQAGIPFREVRIALYTEGSAEQLRRYSPSGKVPVLMDDDTVVWDSAAICEYLAERFPDRQLWPAQAKARAQARSVSAEMHAGFGALRQHMFMNIRRRFPDRGRTPEVLADIARIVALWEDCRHRFGADGDFLFGRFSIADAMYAPVALRFVTYAVDLPPLARTYAGTLRQLPALQEWIAAAHAEPESIPHYEPA